MGLEGKEIGIASTGVGFPVCKKQEGLASVKEPLQYRKDPGPNKRSSLSKGGGKRWKGIARGGNEP